jgi:hypothetical protein
MLLLSIGQLWVGSVRGVCAHAFLGGMGCLVHVGSLKWFLVCEQSPVPTAHRAILEIEIGFLVYAFLWAICQFQLTTSFSTMEECFIFIRLRLGHPIPTQAVPSQHSAHPHQTEMKPSLYLFGHQFCVWGAIFLPAVLDYAFPPEQTCVALTWCGGDAVSFSSGKAQAGSMDL